MTEQVPIGVLMPTPTHAIAVTLDRSSPIPLYSQLADQLSRAITDGTAQPGDPIENEIAMSKRLGLSRPTVRYAIRQLVDQGLVVRKRGLGTFVASQRVHRRVSKGSLYEDLATQGRNPTTRVLSMAREQHAAAAASLEIPPDSELIAIRRLRFADGKPLGIMHNWLPEGFTSITEERLANEGLYAILREHEVSSLVVHQSIAARLPTTDEKSLLEIPARLPVIVLTRSAFQSRGAPVEYAQHVYRSDDYEIDLVIEER